MEKEIKDLKVGDEVIMETYGMSGKIRRIEKVERVTKTLVIVRGTKFKKGEGTPYGYHGYNPTFIRVATKELKEEISKEVMRKKIIQTIEKVDIRKLPLEKLQEIHKIMVE